MPAIGYPYNLIQTLSDFWQRFFADADQLESLYQGTAVQIGQAYMDYMSTVLGVSLRDAIALDRELYKMFVAREDEIRFVEGATVDANRWAYTLPDSVVSFASIDNKVFEPTVSLEPQLDYDVDDGVVLFKIDPTSPAGDGLPIAGFARRGLDISVGGRFTDTAVTDWVAANVRKGDTLRILDLAPDTTQRKRADYSIVLVRTAAVYISSDVPLPSPSAGVVYVILRVPSNAKVLSESMTLVANVGTLAHTRIDQGSVRVFAKNPSGADVIENIDYTVNYEHGKIYALTAWASLPGPYGVDYTWREEVRPAVGVSPRASSTGVVVSSTTTTRVVQMAGWMPDVLVDRRTLSNNFGVFINREGASSEAYRAFIAGIFQLYILGPVLQRIESALNVVLNLPVVRDDGEIYQSTDVSDPAVDRVFTLRPATNQNVAYEFPKGTPFRDDLVAGLVLQSFEPLTMAVTVTDYVQTPDWWHGELIPRELFTPVEGEIPSVTRRYAQPFYVEHVVGAPDDPRVGDPGLIVGADENGFIPPPGHPVFRHRVAFVLMDRYLKYHTFSVKFDAAALSASSGSAFAQSISDLNDLVLSAKPSHTYVFTTPTTSFRDVIEVDETPIDFARKVGSRVYGPDKVLFSDAIPNVGGGVWNVGDYFKYEFFTASTAFPSIGVPVTLANAPGAPRRRRLVLVHVATTIGGLALIEGTDFTVDYANNMVTRLTAWDATTVNVVYRQLNIGNTADAAKGVGDMYLLVNGNDPSTVTGAFSVSAAGWDGVSTPPTAPRDMGMVERALIVSAH
jgi:hypothetical protein